MARYKVKAIAKVSDGMFFEESVPVTFVLECSKDFDAYFKAKSVINGASVKWTDFEVTDKDGNIVGLFKFRK